jgi:hypothetical protein
MRWICVSWGERRKREEWRAKSKRGTTKRALFIEIALWELIHSHCRCRAMNAYSCVLVVPMSRLKSVVHLNIDIQQIYCIVKGWNGYHFCISWKMCAERGKNGTEWNSPFFCCNIVFLIHVLLLDHLTQNIYKFNNIHFWYTYHLLNLNPH